MFAKSCRHAANVLLPFHVNGSLSDQEEGEVRAHMEECAICRSEVETLRGIADVIRSAPAHVEEVSRFGWPLGARVAFAIAATLAVGLPAIVYWWLARAVPEAHPGGAPLAAGTAPAAPVQVADGSIATGDAPGVIRRAAYLDLKGGATRGGEGLPRLQGASEADVVVVALTLPRRPAPTDRLELTTPAGRIVARSEGPIVVDTYGRATLVVPRALLEEGGTYEITVRGADGVVAGPPPTYRFQVGAD